LVTKKIIETPLLISYRLSRRMKQRKDAVATPAE